MLFDQGVVYGRQLGKIMKRFKRIKNTNKNHKDVISRLETIGYGYCKSFKNRPAGNLRRQVSRPGRGRARTKSNNRSRERYGVDYSLVGRRKHPSRPRKSSIRWRKRRGNKRAYSISLPRLRHRDMNDLLNARDREFNAHPIHNKFAKVLHDINNSNYFSKKNMAPLRMLPDTSSKKAHSFQRQ